MFAKLMRNNMLEKPGFRVVWRSSNIWKVRASLLMNHDPQHV